MKEIYFVSGNIDKFLEIQKIADQEYNGKIKITFKKTELNEIQSNDILQIVKYKVKQAYHVIKNPVIVEDDGFFIQSLKGFPGTYASYVSNTIGNEGILRLLQNEENREAFFISIYSFFDGTSYVYFEGKINGKINNTIIPGGWGFDPIFIPEGENQSFSQMDRIKKNKISHRSKAFKKFLSWYLDENK